MIPFTNTRPVDATGQALVIHRTPTNGKPTAISLTHDLVGCWTHFFRNRTVPCQKPRCPACDAQYPARWHAWLIGWNQRANTQFIFEMTAAISEVFADYRDHYGTLRGCQFTTWRPSKKPNGRIACELKPATLNGIILPEPPDLIAVLCKIWNVPAEDAKSNPPNRPNGDGRITNNDRLRILDPTLQHQTAPNHA